MRELQLYQQILGLTEPWRVESVKLNVAEKEVEVRVGYTETMWGCPPCQQRMHIHDYEERRWRHLDSCQFKTIIVSRVPLVKCPVHGVETVAVPWAEKYGRFSRLFERLAIDVMLECSTSGACSILGISWDEADGIKQRAVKRGLARKSPEVMKRLCVDEKGMGGGPNFLTIVAKVTEDQTTVEYGFFRDFPVISNWLTMNRMERATPNRLQKQGVSVFDRRGARAKAQNPPPCSSNSLSDALFHRNYATLAPI